MKITLPKIFIDKIDIKSLREFGVIESQLDWSNNITIDISDFDLKTLRNLQKILTVEQSLTRTIKKPLKELQGWINICENKSPKIKKLEAFEAALIQYIDQSPGHRIYVRDVLHQKVLCYLVTEIQFIPSDGFFPDLVRMEYVFDYFGKRHEGSKDFTYRDVYNKTVQQILGGVEIYLETDTLREEYQKDVEIFKPIISQIGTQYFLNGISTNDTPEAHNNYTRANQFFSDNHKVVIDVLNESNDRSYESHSSETRTTGRMFWQKQHKKFQETEFPLKSDINQKLIEIPIHPILIIFDFRRHLRLTTHVTNLTLYKYDKNLAEKLVLSEGPKTLVRTLIEQKEGGFKDIVSGKSGGIIVLLAGAAGVGKTLTAEVFAESKEKPLYTIQAAQLGVKPEELERELQQCLDRTKRWDAVLLIDEADVYIHKRGNDINQNAIVGAFLRILEYHSSFLFMTTNRSDVVDDAIASRCIAKIDYQLPTKEEQKKIWQILSETSNIQLDLKIIEKFVEKHDVSGRDVKNILKLANLISLASKSPITIDTLNHVIQFNPTQQSKKQIEDNN